MERKVEIKENENGSYTKVTTTKTDPSDGFIHQPEVDRTSRSNYGEYHKGWQVHKEYETNNPKVTIPFLVFFMILVLLIPIGIYLFFPFDNKTVMLIFFSAFALVFEIAIVREIIKVIKNNKKD